MPGRLLAWTLTVLHAVLAVGAVAAGQAFVRDPSGGVMGMSKDYLEGSPFPDFRVPGLFLAVVIGGTNLASALLLIRRDRRAAWWSLGTGMLLVVWLAIQTAIIGFRHWSQAIWWVTFPLVAFLAWLLVRRPRRGDGTR